MVKVYKYSESWEVPALEWRDLETLGIKSEDVEWSKYVGGAHKNRWSRDPDKKLPEIIAKAEEIWLRSWQDAGCPDEGTCTGGNALQVMVIPKRCKYPTRLNIAHAPNAQGNLGKASTRRKAEEYLNEKLKKYFGDKIKVSYYDGWMD